MSIQLFETGVKKAFDSTLCNLKVSQSKNTWIHLQLPVNMKKEFALNINFHLLPSIHMLHVFLQ